MSGEPKNPTSGSVTNKPMKLKTQVMVDNALKSLNERSGSSLVAIKKFISGTYSINVEKSSWAIKKYVKESVESGKFIQTKGKTLCGSFKLSKNALKESEPKIKKKKLEEGASGNAKKTKEGKLPKAKQDSASKKTSSESGSKKGLQPKKTAALKLTATAKKKIAEGAEVPKKKLGKKQGSESVKATAKKKKPTENKVKLPAKKKDKENIPPTKKKPQTKKKEEPSVAPVVDHGGSEGSEGSEDSPIVSPKIRVKEALSFIESASANDEPQEPVDSGENELPEETAEDQLNESDGSLLPEDSPDKPKVKPKGKVGSKSVKKRKSIATLVNPAKPKITKK